MSRFHDKIIQRLITAREEDKLNEGPNKEVTPFLREEFRYTLSIEAMKLLGAGNGAGALGSLAALYYFSNKTELHGLMKFSALVFSTGALFVALGLFAFLLGLTAGARFLDLMASFTDLTKVPDRVLYSGVNSALFLIASIILTFISFVCFVIGMAVTICAIVTL